MIHPILTGLIRDTAQKIIKTQFHKRITITDFEVEKFGTLLVSSALKRIIRFIQDHVPNYAKKDLDFACYNWASMSYVLNKKFFLMDGNVIYFSRTSEMGATLCIDIYGLDASEISEVFGKIIHSEVTARNEHSGEKTVLQTSIICGKGDPDFTSFRQKKEMPNLKDIAGNSAEKVFSMIQRFTNSKKLYQRYRIPYSIKILLYGKPGTGKTSLALAVAKRYTSRIVLISSDSDIYKLEGGGCNFITEKTERPTMYLFEEIDVILEKYKNDNKGIDALLQFLNGASELPNSIIIMTTNYIDNIDSRILRARRVDYSFELTNLSYDEVLPMAKRFHITKEELDTCLSKCCLDENSDYNPAEVEGAILEYCKEYKIKEAYQ